MNDFSAFDIISFIASIASLILAIGAILLSVVFFKMSDAASKATTEAAKGIAASVERLENLFDKLYTDTFSMMRDTVTDMRKHIWNNPHTGNIEKDEISPTVKAEIESRVKAALEVEGIGNKEKQEKVTKQLEGVLESIFKDAKIRKATINTSRVLESIKTNQPVTMDKLSKILGISDDDLAIHLFRMRERGEITWDAPKNTISSMSVVKLGQDDEAEDAKQ
ncbi:hypothetical protein HER14_02820 [Acidithiobacillus thiooxidans]|uniref:hypothetical protein n=1 Tax=Acidithiobacillus TaxID=119977 RepID=UPI00187A53FD|nr:MULTISPECIES: hypothetical protein [Acidithiobacillus]MBE7565368.1 hypothetical protein [Acidithiobacillus sp. HP-11]MBU2749904.1 hypothetical protein [Acidithiobacillus thiooxidans]MBU2792497.1 hypothetical protein [Acidithiobacillus thiooxidans]